MTIKSLTGPARPGVSLDDGSTEKFKVFCRPPQTRNNNYYRWCAAHRLLPPRSAEPSPPPSPAPWSWPRASSARFVKLSLVCTGGA